VIERYLSVTAITKYLKKKIDMDPHLKHVWIKGEISNFKHHSRGHMYFTLKDEQTRLQAVMFARNNRHLKFQLESGLNVLIKGHISVYEPYGSYQLYVTEVEPDGTGALYLAYEQLKEKLRNEGYFKEERKRTIPVYPQHIGIVTSLSGAAVRDIITTVNRRHPSTRLTVIPALVQGTEAAQSIANAIQRANELNMFDVLIVGRGGGSLEELWSFNEKVVADAIYYSNLPVISAVGHETDTTISDLVADLRAPTPTSAAELAVPSKLELHETIAAHIRTLNKQLNYQLKEQQARLKRLDESYAFRYPKQSLADKEQTFDKLYDRLIDQMDRLVHIKHEQYETVDNRLHVQHPAQQVADWKEKYIKLNEQNHTHMKTLYEQNVERYRVLIDKLSLVNPLNIMQRGFAIPYTDDESIIRSGKDLQKDDSLRLRFKDSLVDCRVVDVKEIEDD